MYKDKTVIFIHIPKTGGTSLAEMIKKHYNPAEVQEVKFASINTIKKINENIKLVTGHHVFGHYQDTGPCVYVTMLRDPVERLISQYYYDKYVLKIDGIARYSLEEYAQLDYNVNLQTKYIAGGTVNVKQAISNLKTFAFFGITEMFSESLVLMEKTFGWKNSPYSKINVNEKKPKIETIPKETIEKIEKANFFDIQLYKWAKKHFEKRLRYNK
ncbi:sulfotransferase family 2 domain-containing protein [Alkalihalobacillus hemicellulosilyticus]|uniref:Sulfotransferase family protein n=1 Tax=Halalkalibacter hemicellulosilyticusJCM 9152 TaxID=1236971 RepID=W4QI40_9BACI|nr:sulfotransferase family 2 domain-containing protein [Halalkalibacter hemicellulosilyticus]GAE30984.1 hypothetical protein JCM9152_2419 [Halalkalibacter hemicellulosilyticusJCM 9152]